MTIMPHRKFDWLNALEVKYCLTGNAFGLSKCESNSFVELILTDAFKQRKLFCTHRVKKQYAKHIDKVFVNGFASHVKQAWSNMEHWGHRT